MKRTIPIILVFLLVMTAVPLAVAEKVRSSFLYDEVEDRLTVRLWLERDGVSMRNTSSDKFGDAMLEIYDEAGEDWFPAQTIAPPDKADLTTHIFSWMLEDATTNTTEISLGKGKTYFARCTLRYGGPSGTGFTYQTGTTFTLTATLPMNDVATSAASLRSKIASIKQAVTDENAATLDALKDKAGGVLVSPETQTVQKDSGGYKTAAPILDGDPEVLVKERSVLLGSIVNISFRTYADVTPVVTVYDPDRVVRVATARMIQVEKGRYTFALRLDPSWPEGGYTVVCSEGSHGTMDTLVLTARRKTISDVADRAAPPAAVVAVEASQDAAAALRAAMELAEERLAQAAGAVARMERGAAKTTEVAEYIGSLYNDLKRLGEKIHGMDVDPAGFSVISEARARDFEYLRNKTQEIKALLEVNRRLIEGTLKEEPVIQVWMEFR